MGNFLAIIGFLSFFVFLMLTIISAIKKSGKTKRNAKGILAAFIIFLIGSALSPTSPKSDNGKKENNMATNVQSKDTVKNEEQNANVKVTGNLKVHYIDVGQADSILIEQNKHFMLIDAGNNDDSDLVVNYLKKQGVSKLDYVIGTHPHEDHIGGLDVVIKNFDIGKVLMPKKTSTTATYKDVIKAVKSKKLEITAPVPNTSYDLAEAKWTILAPSKDKDYEDANNYSIVCRLKYGNTTFLFDGDAEAVSEMEMVKADYDLKADVLKVGHHGSNSSSCVNFLNAVNPKYVVVSVGKDNKYGHPHKQTMERLKGKNIPIYRTDECGTIVATSDGDKITFSTKPGDYKYSGTVASSKSEATANIKENSNKSSTSSYSVKKSTSSNKSSTKHRKSELSTSNNTNSQGHGLIKGSKNRIYHVPGSTYYNRTKNVVRWFKTVEESEAAGYRPPKR